MAVTASGSGTQTSVINTEHFVHSIAIAGIFSFHVDLSNMALGDTVELRIYQKILSTDSALVAYYQAFYDAQPDTGIIAISVPIANELTIANSLRFSIKQTAGTARDYKWKVLSY